MEFNFSLRSVFRSPVAKVGNSLVPEGSRFEARGLRSALSSVAEVVDAMGLASMKAQGMVKPVTTAERLRASDHTLYLLLDLEANSGRGCVVGLLKVGWKRLYVFDPAGECYNDPALCILDFYVHESRQRMGCGATLFQHMLQETGARAEQLAIDKPSDKFLGFLRKHYGLTAIVPQTNNFVVYQGFFSHKPSNGNDALNCGRSTTSRHSWAGREAERSGVATYIGRHAAHKPRATIGQIIHSSAVL